MLRKKIETIAILLVTYLIPNSGYYYGSPIWTHFTYMFAHANLLHLICNLYALYICISKRINLFHVYIIGVAVSFIAMNNIPTVGASSCVYVMLGINVYGAKRKTHLIAVCAVLLGFLMPNVNAWIHVYSYILGMTYYAILIHIRMYNDDSQRINIRK